MKMYTKDELKKIADDYNAAADERLEKALNDAEKRANEFFNIRMYEYAAKGLKSMMYDLGMLKISVEKASEIVIALEDFVDSLKKRIADYWTNRGFTVDLSPSIMNKNYIKISWE